MDTIHERIVTVMFTMKRKYEIVSDEVMNFVRLIGRFGLKFKVSDEYVVDDPEKNTKTRYRRFVIYGTHRQLSDFQEAKDIIYDYNYMN